MRFLFSLIVALTLLYPAASPAQTWKMVSPGPCDTGGEGSGGGSDPSGFPAATTLDPSCASLSIGQTCHDSAGLEVFYIGTLNGKRLYGMMSDISTSIAYKSENTAGGGPSVNDGLVNTSVMTLPTNLMFYPAAVACKAVGISYYLPAKDELNLIWTNRSSINLSAKGILDGAYYWSSTENGTNSVWHQYFHAGQQYTSNQTGIYKVTSARARCIRR